MKRITTDEVERELGYRIEHPERSDWMIGIGIVLIMGAVFVGILLGVLKLIGRI